MVDIGNPCTCQMTMQNDSSAVVYDAFGYIGTI
jgi:hypothetical protein